MTVPRIAILGISLESNRFARPCQRRNFEDYALLYGEDILTSDIVRYWTGTKGGDGFLGEMDRLRDWTPVPVMVVDGQSSGPLDHETYLEFRQSLKERLAKEYPVDGVYIIAHGAGLTTQGHDMDGDYFAAVREVVGDEVPIVATLDLHGNLTPEMIKACDVVIAQRTNPHMDSPQRAEEAARCLNLLLKGEKFYQAAQRVPLLTPQVSQLTATNEPYGQLMQAADEQLQQEGMLTNSLLSGFAFGDTPHNGFWSYACARTQSTATKNAQKMAQAIWEKREAFRRHLLSVDEAVQLAGQTPPSLGPRLFADVADNPGGGAAGNTMWLIDAFLKADIQNVIAGIIHDPLVVKDAHEAGVGAKLTVRFNRENPQTFSEPLTAEGEVIWVGSGDYQSSMGVYKGSLVPLGPSCVLQIKGIKIIVVTVQQQLLGNDCFHHFGLEAKDAHSVIIKSRGHFRAGFKGVTSEDNIYEVDAPGLTTANLAHVDWQNLTRPIALLDEMDWTPGEGYLFPPRDSLKFSASR